MFRGFHYLLSAVGVLATLAGCGPAPHAAPPDPGVVVAPPLTRTVIDFETYTGRVEAVETVEIRARVYGYLDKVHFTDGDLVQKGDLLYEIDPAPYQAIEDQNKSKIEVQKARLELARTKHASYDKLVKTGAASVEQFNEAVAARDVAIAELEAAGADERRSALDLQYTKIYAPITGKISRTEVTKGNLIIAGLSGTTALTTIVSIDPVYVYFDVDELSYRRYQERRKGNADPHQRLSELKIPFGMELAGEKGYPRTGYIDFAENRVDAGTGTLRVRGHVRNDDHKVTPGLFVRVKIQVSEPYEAVLVPQRAIGVSQSKHFVFVVDDDNIARQHPVELGEARGSWRIVKTKFKPEEKIVVEGLQKIREDAKVTPRDAKEEDLPAAPPEDKVPEVPADAEAPAEKPADPAADKPAEKPASPTAN